LACLVYRGQGLSKQACEYTERDDDAPREDDEAKGMCVMCYTVMSTH